MRNKISFFFGLFWMSGFIALQGIPHAGAIKTMFSLLGIGHLVFLLRNSNLKPVWPKLNAEVLLFIALSCWLLFQSSLLATTPMDALAALVKEWGKLVLMVLLGVWMVVRLDDGKSLNWLPWGLFGGCFVHVIATIAYQIWSYVIYGHLMLMNSFLGNYGYVSPFVSIALAVLLAELSLRLRGQQWLKLSGIWLFVLFFLSLLSLAILNTKAAIVAFVMLCLLFALVAVVLTKSLRSFAMGVILGGTVIALTLLWGNRWEGGYTSIAMASSVNVIYQAQHLWDTGTIIGDPSFYVRAIWMKVGLYGILEHPLGLGYGADAFGRYVAELGGERGAISSHSGWVDFTLANGIPGFLLLFLLWVAMIYRGWVRFCSGSPVGLVLIFFVANFVMRSLMDGHLYGSHLIYFSFVASILWMLSRKRELSVY